MLTPVAPRLDTIEPVLALLALHAPHNQPRQIAVQILFLLRRERRLGCGAGGEAVGGQAALHGAAGHGFDGCGGGFGAARGG